LGCGDGALTQKIVESGAWVVGVDSALDQITATANLGIPAVVMDGHEIAFDGAFDGILTNAALHWMRRPDLVIEGMWRALRPGGRLVGEMGGAGNVACISNALSDELTKRGLDSKSAYPWYFPDPDEYQARLETRGFEIRSIELIPRPTPLPGDISEWIHTFGEQFLSAVPVGDQAGFLDDVSAKLRPSLFDPTGQWVADYVRLRFAAIRPELGPNEAVK
jgi:SAM-dependent methyltransferase